MPDRTHVLTIGTFDPPHLGHAFLFQRCADLGPLTVGINSDRFVTEYRLRPPALNEAERSGVIALLGYETVINDGPGRALIYLLRPRMLAVGSDWATRGYHEQIGVSQDELDDLDITLVFIPRRGGLSSSMIRERLGC